MNRTSDGTGRRIDQAEMFQFMGVPRHCHPGISRSEISGTQGRTH
jgi:hypothetical protein